MRVQLESKVREYSLRVKFESTVREYSLRVQFENSLIVLRARDFWLLALL